MEPCKPLAIFFEAISRDPRICSTHIGLFAALLQLWQIQGCPKAIRAYAHEVMPLAKILANTTFHRCIRDLHDLGYIIYEPSYKRNQRSYIYLKTERCDDGQNRDRLPRK